MHYAGGMMKEALEEPNRLERELISSIGKGSGRYFSDWGAWGWLDLVKSAVEFGGGVQAGRPRWNWKFLTGTVLGPLVSSGIDEEDKPRVDAGSTSSAQAARYIQVLKDYIMGGIHWGYETDFCFGQKGDEIRSFGSVFLTHSNHS